MGMFFSFIILFFLNCGWLSAGGGDGDGGGLSVAPGIEQRANRAVVVWSPGEQSSSWIPAAAAERLVEFC